MKRIDISGWKKVFMFTFFQNIKTKSFYITLAIMCIAVAVAIPVIAYMNYDGQVNESPEHVSIENIEKVYISYEKDNDLDELMKVLSSRYACDMEYLEPEKTADVSASFNESEDAVIIIEIKQDSGVYSVNVISGWNISSMQVEIDSISYDIQKDLKELQLKGVIDQSYMENIGKEVKAYTVGEDDAEDENFMNKYFIWLSCITIVTFIVTFAGQSLATSVVTEKSSKLVEYLLISVRPMALVAGKMAASFASLMVQIGAIIMSAVLSLTVSGIVLGFNVGEVVGNTISGGDISSMFGGINLLSVIIAIINMILGVIFFLFIAGIAGAAVSKMEEMAEGMVMFTMLVIVGAYMSLALSMGNMFNENGQLSGVFAMVCCLLPISSVFTVPANLMMGSVSIGIGIVSILILIVSNIIMLFVTSKIYEYLLFYNGVTLKIKDIIYLIRHGRVKEAK